jgi:hypothetical protein
MSINDHSFSICQILDKKREHNETVTSASPRVYGVPTKSIAYICVFRCIFKDVDGILVQAKQIA